MLYHTLTERARRATKRQDYQTQTKINALLMLLLHEQDVFNCLPCQWSPDC